MKSRSINLKIIMAIASLLFLFTPVGFATNYDTSQVDITSGSDLTLQWGEANDRTLKIQNTDAGKVANLYVEGNAGIGVSAPSQKLSVVGTFGLIETGASPQYYSIFQGGDQAADLTYTLPTAYPASNGMALVSTTAGVMSWGSAGVGGSGTTNYLPKWTAGTTLGDSVIFDNGTNVGIGLTNPTRKLSLSGNFGILETGSSPQYYTAFQTNDQNADITYTLPAAVPVSDGQVLSSTIGGVMSWSSNVLPAATTDGRTLRDNGTNWIANTNIFNDGTNVGIGTSTFDASNPEKLKIDAIGTTNILVGLANIDSFAQLNIKNQNAGSSASSDLVATANNGDDTTNYVDLGINSSTYSVATYSIAGPNDAYLYTTGNDFSFGTANANKVIKFHTGGTLAANERMRIDGAGNVGIGTTSPLNKLDIKGAGVIGATYAGTNTAPANGLLVEGNVGIGTITAVNKLDVEGGVAIGSAYSGTSVVPAEGLLVQGNVGIGTTAVLNKLDVEGGAAIGANYSGGISSPANGLIVQGNTGIGTSSPTEQLEVNGNLKVTTSSGTYELAPSDGTLNVNGNVAINGNLSKTTGTFDIVHPDPVKAQEGYRLRHYFVESPTAGDNIYRWKIEVKQGQAKIILPEYFKFLNKDAQVWVSPIKHFGRAWGEVNSDSTQVEVAADIDGMYNVVVIATRADKDASDYFSKHPVEYKK